MNKATAQELTKIHNDAIATGQIVETKGFDPGSGEFSYVVKCLKLKSTSNTPNEPENLKPPNTFYHRDGSSTFFYYTEKSRSEYAEKNRTKGRKFRSEPQVEGYFPIRVWYP